MRFMGFGKFWKMSRMRFIAFFLLMDKMSNWFITFIVGIFFPFDQNHTQSSMCCFEWILLGHGDKQGEGRKRASGAHMDWEVLKVKFSSFFYKWQNEDASSWILPWPATDYSTWGRFLCQDFVQKLYIPVTAQWTGW
jgi:hypothetical protein